MQVVEGVWGHLYLTHMEKREGQREGTQRPGAEGHGPQTGQPGRPRERTSGMDTGKVPALSPSLVPRLHGPNTHRGQVVPDPGPTAAPVLP